MSDVCPSERAVVLHGQTNVDAVFTGVTTDLALAIQVGFALSLADASSGRFALPRDSSTADAMLAFRPFHRRFLFVGLIFSCFLD